MRFSLMVSLVISMCVACPTVGVDEPRIVEVWPGKAPDEIGNVGDGDELIDTIPDEDLGLTANFIMLTDPLVNSATIGGDYHLVPGAEAIDAGTAARAPDHDSKGCFAPRPFVSLTQARKKR